MVRVMDCSFILSLILHLLNENLEKIFFLLEKDIGMEVGQGLHRIQLAKCFNTCNKPLTHSLHTI